MHSSCLKQRFYSLPLFLVQDVFRQNLADPMTINISSSDLRKNPYTLMILKKLYQNPDFFYTLLVTKALHHGDRQ